MLLEKNISIIRPNFPNEAPTLGDQSDILPSIDPLNTMMSADIYKMVITHRGYKWMQNFWTKFDMIWENQANQKQHQEAIPHLVAYYGVMRELYSRITVADKAAMTLNGSQTQQSANMCVGYINTLLVINHNCHTCIDGLKKKIRKNQMAIQNKNILVEIRNM